MTRLALLIVLGLFVSGTGWSQSSKKVEKKGRIVVGNLGTDSISVMCRRYEITIADSSENYFCWDACYPPFVGVSNGPVSIAGGDTSAAFYMVFTPGVPGTSIIKYCFYVEGAPEDSACLTMAFDENSPSDTVYGLIYINPYVGIEFIGTTNQNKILDIYPNPSDKRVTINYSLKQNSKYGKILVRDILGRMIYEVVLTGTIGQVTIPVEEINNGVYFCTIVVDTELFGTARMIVKH